MQKASLWWICGIAALAVLIVLSNWFGMGDPASIDGSEVKSVKPGNPDTAAEIAQPGGSDAADPAAALELGLWPGLPAPPKDADTDPDLDDPVRYTALEIDDAKEKASSVIDGPYAEMVAAVDDLSGSVKAEVAVEIGDRLFECWNYSEKRLDELEEEGARAFENKRRLDEIFAAQMAPGVAEQAVRDMAMLDRDQWIGDWIAGQLTERETNEARCGGVETVPEKERMGAAFDWWERAAALGSLEAKAQWVGMAFINAKPYLAGSAVEIAELKPRVLDTIHELLRERYAPVLYNLALYERQGTFAQPDPQRVWIYGEALRRIIERGAVGHWRLSDEKSDTDLDGLRGELDRIKGELTPMQRREAEAWVQAIVDLPAR